MPETLGTLLYGSAIDLSGLERSAREARAQLKGIGDFAAKTFDERITRTLANSVRSTDVNTGVARAKAMLGSLGIDVGKTWQRTLGANLARQTLKPFVDESSTFLGQLKGGFASTLGVGKVALGVGLGGILAEVGLGLARTAKESMEFAAQFETALARVQTIAGKDFDLKGVREEIKDIAARLPQDLLTLTRGLADVIGSGFQKTADAMQILETSAKAATAGFTETATAASGIVFILNAFQKSAEDAGNVSDVLFRVVDEGVITFEQLATQIGEVASPAALAGVTLEDLGAAIAVTTQGGINAAETMTGLKNAILSIVAPTSAASKAAKDLGIDMSKAGIQAAGGFKEFVALIARATEGDIKKIERLFPEKRALREIAILAGTMDERFQELAGTFRDLNSVQGATNKALGIVNETATAQFKIFRNNLLNAVVEVGTGLLDGLKPALAAVNELFSDATPIENLVKNLQNLGIASEQVKFLSLIEQGKKAQERIVELNAEIQKLAESTEFIEKAGGLLGFGKRGIVGSFLSGETVGELAKQTANLLKTEEGRAQVNRQIADSNARVVELSQRLGEVNLGLREGDAGALKKQIEAEITRRRTLETVLGFQDRITEQSKKAAEAQENARLELDKQRGVAFEVAVTAERIGAATRMTAEQQEKNAKRAEEAEKFIAEAANKLQLLGAASDIERRLIAIGQEAEARRKMYADNAKAIKAVNALERAEIARTLDEAINAIKTKIRGVGDTTKSITEQLKLELKAGIVAEFEAGDVKIEGIEALADDLRGALSDIAYPLEAFLTDLERMRIATQDDFVALADMFDRGLGDVTASLFNFVNTIANPSGTILGGVLAGVNLLKSIGKLFGGGRSDAQKRIDEAQKRAADEAAKAAEDLRRAFERLKDTLDTAAINELDRQLKETQQTIAAITKSTVDLTRVDLDYLQTLAAQATELQQQIETAEELGDWQLADQLRRQLDAVLAEITKFGFDTRNLTAAQIEQLKILLEQSDAIKQAIANFGKFAETFTGQIEKLGLKFNLLNIEDPAKKLELLSAVLKDKFGAALPTSIAAIRKFIEDGLAAFETGGQTLVDYLKSLNLEELTAEEFADLLRTLNEFAKGVDGAGKEIADALDGLLDKLQLKFNLLNIEDPLKQLELMQQALAATFGAALPKGVDQLRTFIKNGLDALLAGGSKLEAFLEKQGLEELSAEQFRTLLGNIDSLLDAIESRFSSLVGGLNLQFDLLDIDDPIKKLEMLRASILKQFKAIIPTTKEGIDALVAKGIGALLAGGEELEKFLASINLEELTAKEFEELLKLLKGFADEAAQTIEGAAKAAEEITTAQVKSITYTQGNKLIDEVTTMRIVLTQMLDRMRAGAFAAIPAVDYGNLAAAMTGLNAGVVRNNYFFIRDGTVTPVGESQLGQIDRRLLEQARAAARARGIG